jgi:hypothetical protein
MEREEMRQFKTKIEMESAWIEATAAEMHFRLNAPETRNDAEGLADKMVKGKAVYVPHLYRGGYVIREFGYSTDRLGMGIIDESLAGHPELV